MTERYKPGEIWKHKRGLTLRVLEPILPPGDRHDSPRTYCEVVGQYERGHVPAGADDYPIGHRDGWNLYAFNGWARVNA